MYGLLDFLHCEVINGWGKYQLYFICNHCQSTWASHRSTNPWASAGIIFVENCTTSFSADSIARITLSGLNVNWDMPSKHFLRCGCTRRGSLVSDNISNSSSLDKKKNLGGTRNGMYQSLKWISCPLMKFSSLCCNGSCQYEIFQNSQWRKFHQTSISVSMMSGCSV